MDIPNQLIALTTALVDKLGKQPHITIRMEIRALDHKPYEIIWYEDLNMREQTYFSANSAEEALQLAEDHIAAMPDAATTELMKWQKEFSDLIDKAPPAVDVLPLQQVNQAIHENLLEYHP